MTPEHIARAVLETCPHRKEACFLAQMGGCAAVEIWLLEHKADQWYGGNPWNISAPYSADSSGIS